MSAPKDPMQGEGDRISARAYNRDVREFIREGKVDEAAEDARLYVERDPDDAERAEEKARRGPRAKGISVDELVAKGHTVVERIQRAAKKLRNRFRK
jgi:hypothetical protein